MKSTNLTFLTEYWTFPSSRMASAFKPRFSFPPSKSADSTAEQYCVVKEFRKVTNDVKQQQENAEGVFTRLVKCLVTAEKGRSFSSGCQSQSSILMWPCSTSHSLDTTIRTSSHSTFAFNLFLCFNPWNYTTRGSKNK